MSEIEDVSRTASGFAENSTDFSFEVFATSQQRTGVEIALNGVFVSDTGPGLVESNAPVDAGHRCSGFRHGR